MRSGTIGNNRLFFTLLLWLAVGVVGITLSGCSTQKNYPILKIFFDGVPKPGTTQKKLQPSSSSQRTPDSQAKKSSETFVAMKSRHPDYLKNICTNCHDNTATNFLRTAKKEDICFTCHKPQLFTDRYVHGPVTVKACLACHLPHESPQKKLLRAETIEMCRFCHNQPSQSPPDTCQRETVCTHCHNPHAADNRFFLKQTGR